MRYRLNPASDVTVVIAHIPTREKQLKRALRSVDQQTYQPREIVVVTDKEHAGAAVTKNQGIALANTEWIAMLDDDDAMLPYHLQELREAVRDHDADVAYSVPLIPQNPRFVSLEPMYFRPFDAATLRARSYIQTTSLARTALLTKAGGFGAPAGSDYDDWGCWLRMLDAGARFVHVPRQTFIWNHTGPGRPGKPGNTSGRGDRW